MIAIDLHTGSHRHAYALETHEVNFKTIIVTKVFTSTNTILRHKPVEMLKQGNRDAETKATTDAETQPNHESVLFITNA